MALKTFDVFRNILLVYFFAILEMPDNSILELNF